MFGTNRNGTRSGHAFSGFVLEVENCEQIERAEVLLVMALILVMLAMPWRMIISI